MHTITERTEELVREAGIRTRIAIDTLMERAREERGQTAAEYMGILFIVALIIGALITAKVPSKIGDAAGKLIDEIAAGGN
jgi:Flp pilus assembly pilin Flp